MAATDSHRPTYAYMVGNVATVQFYKEDGSGAPLYQERQPIGLPAVYNGEEPTKASDGSNSYVFDGWSDDPYGFLD